MITMKDLAGLRNLVANFYTVEGFPALEGLSYRARLGRLAPYSLEWEDERYRPNMCGWV